MQKLLTVGVSASKLASTLNLASSSFGSIPTTSVKPMFVNFYTNSVLTITNDSMVKLNMEAQGLNNGVTWDTTNYRCTFDANTAGKYLIIMSVSYYNNNNKQVQESFKLEEIILKSTIHFLMQVELVVVSVWMKCVISQKLL